MSGKSILNEALKDALAWWDSTISANKRYRRFYFLQYIFK